MEVSFNVFLLGDGTYEIYVGLEDGPTHRFTHDPADDADASARAPRLERVFTAEISVA